jgi:hypothetical protein
MTPHNVCVHIDRVTRPCRITTCKTEAGGKAMIATLSTAYPTYDFELVSDDPTEELEEYHPSLYEDLRYVLIKPIKRRDAQASKLLVIDGGLS